MRRYVHAILGITIIAAVDLLINLLAAAIQQRTFADQFSEQSTWFLVVLVILGLILGNWLGTDLNLRPENIDHPPSSDSSETSKKRRTITMTRFRALLSYGKLRGKGIHLSDIILIGSRIDINTKS